LEHWPLEGSAPLCPAIILSRPMDEGASRRAGWQPGRRARRPAWQAPIIDVIKGYDLAVPGEPKQHPLLSLVGAIEQLRRLRPSPRGRSSGAGANMLPS
jgi:hypothetical protein